MATEKVCNLSTDLQKKLEDELEKLKRKLSINDLQVIWIPEGDLKLSGKVEGNMIFIYEVDEEKAIDALRHELIDYIISKVIEPYRAFANKLVELMNEEAYKRKEQVIETLKKLIELSN